MNSANKSGRNEVADEYVSPPRLNGVLTCIYCPATFMAHESLEKHVKRNHSGKNKAGNECSKVDSTEKAASIALPRTFAVENAAPDAPLSIVNLANCSSSTGTLKKHSNDGFLEPLNVKKIKTSFKSGIKCLYCPYNHPSINNVRAHIIQAHSREVEKPKRVSVQSESNENVPKKGTVFQLKCTKDRNCCFSTHSLGLLKAHHLQKHTKTLHPCPLCIKKFTRHPDLTKHILMDHSGVPNRRQDNIKRNMISMEEENSNSIFNASQAVTLRGNEQMAYQGQLVSNKTTDDYPFDFDGLKAYLKVFTSVKKIFDTTNDAQLKAEILEKDKYNLLGHRGKSEASMVSNKNNHLVMIASNEHPTGINSVEGTAKIKNNSNVKIFTLEDTTSEVILSDISPVKQVSNKASKPVAREEIEEIPQSKPLEKRMTGKQFRSLRRAITPRPNS